MLNENVISALSHPDVMNAIDNFKVNREHDVPYVAGPSDKGDTLYIDKSVPKLMNVSGVSFDPAIPLGIHEFTERHVMNNLTKKGMTDNKAYEIAHHEYAEPAEDAWYRAQGIDVGEVNKAWTKLDRHTEQETSDDKNYPKDLFTKPYSHGKVAGMKHEESGASAEWAIGKLAMDDDARRRPISPAPGGTPPLGQHTPHTLPPSGAKKPETLTEDLANRSALKSTQGQIFTGMNHGDALEKLEAAGHNIDFKTAAETIDAQGFITSTGRFVGRDEASKLAVRAGQADRKVGKYLTSEDLDPYTYEKWQMMKQGMDPSTVTSPKSLQGWSDPDKPLTVK